MTGAIRSVLTVAIVLATLGAGPAGSAGDATVKHLIDDLKSPDVSVRVRAAESLGRVRDLRAGHALIAALKDREWSVREAAARALGAIRDARAVQPLIATLSHDPSWGVKQAAAEALGRIGNRRAVEPLLQAMKATDWLLRLAAIQALGQIGDPRAVEPLVAVLDGREDFFHGTAALALARLGDPRAVGPLIAALKEGDSDTRKAAAQALGRIGDPRAVDALIAAYRGASGRDCWFPVWALAHIDGAGAVDTLIAAARDPDEVVRETAVSAVGRMEDPRVVATLLPALTDRCPWVACAAALRLGATSKPEAVVPLANAALRSKRVPHAGAAGLRLINDPRAAGLLAAGLKDADARVRGNAASALAMIGDARGVEPLVAALKDEDAGVRWTAANALGVIRDGQAVEPLIALLEDADRDVRDEAAQALGWIGSARAAEGLVRVLSDEDETVRASAAAALGRISARRAIEPLSGALKDPVWLVRDAAGWALKALTGRDPLLPEKTGQPAPVKPATESRWAVVSAFQAEGARKAGLESAIEVRLADDVTIKMLFIPRGTFTMGDVDQPDNPPHQVTFTRGFYMAVHQVTVHQFRAFLDATGYRTDAERNVRYEGAHEFTVGKGTNLVRDSSWRTPGFEQGDDHPVVSVSRNDAEAFCRWLSRNAGRTFRLPTEAQWEYGCRAGRSSAASRYPWGPDWPPPRAAGNYWDETYKAQAQPGCGGVIPGYRDGWAFTSPVGRYPPNAWGLCDMGGNVYEWARDWYVRKPGAHARDPEGPPTGWLGMLRGATWYSGNSPLMCQSAYSQVKEPWKRMAHIGFRVVMVGDPGG